MKITPIKKTQKTCMCSSYFKLINLIYKFFELGMQTQKGYNCSCMTFQILIATMRVHTYLNLGCCTFFIFLTECIKHLPFSFDALVTSIVPTPTLFCVI